MHMLENTVILLFFFFFPNYAKHEKKKTIKHIIKVHINLIILF